MIFIFLKYALLNDDRNRNIEASEYGFFSINAIHIETMIYLQDISPLKIESWSWFLKQLIINDEAKCD